MYDIDDIKNAYIAGFTHASYGSDTEQIWSMDEHREFAAKSYEFWRTGTIYGELPANCKS